jgi:hypothetical protein
MRRPCARHRDALAGQEDHAPAVVKRPYRRPTSSLHRTGTVRPSCQPIACAPVLRAKASAGRHRDLGEILPGCLRRGGHPVVPGEIGAVEAYALRLRRKCGQNYLQSPLADTGQQVCLVGTEGQRRHRLRDGQLSQQSVSTLASLPRIQRQRRTGDAAHPWRRAFMRQGQLSAGARERHLRSASILLAKLGREPRAVRTASLFRVCRHHRQSVFRTSGSPSRDTTQHAGSVGAQQTDALERGRLSRFARFSAELRSQRIKRDGQRHQASPRSCL